MSKVDAGGAAFLATHIAALRADNPNTVLVSAGDVIGASPLVLALFHDEPTIEVMNQLGLAYNAVGNHEFDKGTAELLRMQSGGCSPIDGCADGTPFPGASFQFLAANVLVAQEPIKTLFPSYAVHEVGGAKIGFIGMTLEGTPGIVTPAGCWAHLRSRGRAGQRGDPQLTALGVEAIVVLIHEGGYQAGTFDECVGISGAIVDIATNLSDKVDLVVSGHTHQAYNCIIGDKVVTSASSFGRVVSDIDLYQHADRRRDLGDRDERRRHPRRGRPRHRVVREPVQSPGGAAGEQTDWGRSRRPSSSCRSRTGRATRRWASWSRTPSLAATADPKFGGAQIAFMEPGRRAGQPVVPRGARRGQGRPRHLRERRSRSSPSATAWSS